VGGFNWTIELETEETARLPMLQYAEPFEQIAKNIPRSMSVLCCHADIKSGTAFIRVAYCVQIERNLFDLFFNSAQGYRAAYFRSPWEGMRANTTFLNAVAPKLLSSAPSSRCGLPDKFKRKSLTTPSAKVWLAEQGNEVKGNCITCQGEWSASSVSKRDRPEIRNGRWEYAQTTKAQWGCKAPYLTKLRIFGAFLDVRFNELVPWNKRFRAKEIYEIGWS
jgi:hypothetical protein